MLTTKSPSMLNQEEIGVLSDLLFQDLDNILIYFGVSRVRRTQQKIYGACPIHDGDATRAPFNLFLTGDYTKGNWKCRSHNCHEVFKKSVIGFIRGLLSKKNGWQQKGDPVYSFGDTVKWCLEWTKQDAKSLHIDKVELDKMRFVSQSRPTLIQHKPSTYISRDVVRARLSFPAKSFVERGYWPQVLDKYDIGESTTQDPKKEMHCRVVVPIYDPDRNYLVGCTGRSIYPKCQKCKFHHTPDKSCPNDGDFVLPYLKWRHSETLKAEENLFNYWFAKKYIQQTSTAVVVESIGNVLRLEQAGIHNAVATFGTYLSEQQQLLLAKLGTLNIILIPDNDENGAGKKGAETIKQKYSRLYNFYVIDNIPKPDVGDMTEEEVKQFIMPTLQKLGAV